MTVSSEIERARAAKLHMSHALQGREGITGIGLGRAASGGFAVEILLTDEHAGDAIPTVFDGVPVTTRIVGRARAY
jgi:hypothetical protein